MSKKVVFNASKKVVDRIGHLSELSMDEIKALWFKLFEKEPPHHIRTYLERRISYRLQEIEFKLHQPELAENNEHRIENLIKRTKQARTEQHIKPLPGMEFIKEYKGQEHKVIVTEDSQFYYEGRIFRSLSKIAKEITGTAWSGPVFFGLKKRNRPKKKKAKKS